MVNKTILKLIISPIIGILAGSFYYTVYGFSLEASTISSLIIMILMILILNLVDDVSRGN